MKTSMPVREKNSILLEADANSQSTKSGKIFMRPAKFFNIFKNRTVLIYIQKKVNR